MFSLSVSHFKVKFLTKLQHSEYTTCRLFKNIILCIGYCARTFVQFSYFSFVVVVLFSTSTV